MPTLGTSYPQRQVLYSASKDVNSSVGLCFRSWPQKKHRPTKKMEHFRFICSHSVLSTKITYGNLFIFVFLSPIGVGHSVLPTRMTYGNLFIFVFLESHSGWPYSKHFSLKHAFSCAFVVCTVCSQTLWRESFQNCCQRTSSAFHQFEEWSVVEIVRPLLPFLKAKPHGRGEESHPGDIFVASPG